MKRLVVLLFLVAGFRLLHALPPDELPFGSFKLDNMTSAEIAQLADSMHFNIFVTDSTINSATIGLFDDNGLKVIRNGHINLSQAEPQTTYGWSNYAVVDVGYSENYLYNYPNFEVKLIKCGGEFDDTMWISDSTDLLYGIDTHIIPDCADRDSAGTAWPIGFWNQYFFGYDPLNWDEILWNLEIVMKIDELGDDSDLVAMLEYELGPWDACENHLVFLDSLRAGSFSAADQWQTISYQFTFPDTIHFLRPDASGNCTQRDSIPEQGGHSAYSAGFTLKINTTGAREVSVKQVRLFDEFGANLLNGVYDNQINSVFASYLADSSKIDGWFIRDEPQYANFLPFRHIDSLMSNNWQNWESFTFFNVWHQAYSYLSIVPVDYVVYDVYPIGTDVPYSGPDFQVGMIENAFNKALSRRSDRTSLVEGKEWWLAPQSHNGWNHRMPTASELSLQTFMGLAWGCRGIIYYTYDASSGSIWGLRDNNGDPTPLYYEVKDCIGPYVRAFDEFYMPLDWDSSYTYNPASPDIPAGSCISAISAFSHPDSANPDVGWFQVGEFHDDYNNYFMLVNRACSKDEDGNEAGSVTAIVQFDSSFTAEDDLYVIDLAHEVDSSGGEWYAIPETTYTRKYDGLLYFTTVLKAGEGRLFKIAAAGTPTRSLSKPVTHSLL